MKKQAMSVKDVMTSPVHTCRVDDSLDRAAQLLWEHDCGCLPVVDTEGIARSMITDRDICMAAYTGGRPLRELRVVDSMSRGLVVCSPDDELRTAAERMAEHQLRRLPVVDDAGRVQGVLSVNDLACRAADSCTSSIDDPPAAEMLRVLMAVCRHRGAEAEVPEVAAGISEIRPPARESRQPSKETRKTREAKSTRHPGTD